MIEREAEIVQFFSDYAADFSRLGIQTILHYFHRPCMVIAPQGVFALISDIEVEQLFEPMFENLKAQGYTRSDWVEMQVKFLNDKTAVASNVAAYYNAEGVELERTGGTYALHETDKGWKIAVIIVHGPDSVLSL